MKNLSTPSSKFNAHTLPAVVGSGQLKLYGVVPDSATKYQVFKAAAKLCKETEAINRSLRATEILYGRGVMVPMVIRLEYELYRLFITAIMRGKVEQVEVVTSHRIEVPEELMHLAYIKNRETGFLTDEATWELNGEIVCDDLLVVCHGHPLATHSLVLNPPPPAHLGVPARRKRVLDF